MSMRSCPCPRLALLALGAALLTGPTWPRDDSGVPNPPETWSATDPQGWGRSFVPAGLQIDVTAGRAAAGYMVSDDVWVLHLRQAGASPRPVETYLSADAGGTWALLVTGTPSFTFTDPVRAERVGSRLLLTVLNGVGNDGLLTSVDEGQTWAAVDLPGIVDAQGLSLAVRDTVVLAAVNDGGVEFACRSTDGGATWSACTNLDGLVTLSVGPPASQALASTIAPPQLDPSRRRVWLLGGGLTASPGTILRSTDDGATWTTVFTAGNGVLALRCLAGAHTDVCLATNGTTLYRSADTGLTWAAVPGVGAAFGAAGFLDYGEGRVQTVPTAATPLALRSTDAGATWLPAGAGGGGVGSSFGTLATRAGRALVTASGGASVSRWLLVGPTVGAGARLAVGRGGRSAAVDAAGLRTSGTGLAQGPTLLNQQLTSGANAAVTFSAGTTPSGERVHLYRVEARCSAGSASLTIADTGTTIFSTGATEVGAVNFVRAWTPALTSRTDTNPFAVTLGACGVGNTGTLIVQADRY